MKRWAQEIFVGDAAMDFVGDLVDQLAARIEVAVSESTRLEPDEYYGQVVPCIVAILANLRELTGTAAIPEPSVVAAWTARYMETWKSYFEKVGTQHMLHARRAALKSVFDKLVQQSKTVHGDG